MLISSRHLAIMGATPEIIDIYRRTPLIIQWTRKGYQMRGAITAQGLSASEVIRFIAAAKNFKKMQKVVDIWCTICYNEYTVRGGTPQKLPTLLTSSIPGRLNAK